jgi:hypothetical protein
MTEKSGSRPTRGSPACSDFQSPGIPALLLSTSDATTTCLSTLNCASTTRWLQRARHTLQSNGIACEVLVLLPHVSSGWPTSRGAVVPHPDAGANAECSAFRALLCPPPFAGVRVGRSQFGATVCRAQR